MMRRTPMAQGPFQRKKGTKNKPSNSPESHSQQAQVAIKCIVKMQPKTATSSAPAAPAFRGSFPKSAPVRNETYRRLVAAMPCVICGMVGYGQAAHGSAGKGMGIKASDLELFSACCDRPGVRGCHSLLDQGALFSKAARHALEPAWAADTQRRIHAMGKWPRGVLYPHDQQQGAGQ